MAGEAEAEAAAADEGGFDPEDLLARHVEVAEPMPMPSIHRELALQIKSA